MITVDSIQYDFHSVQIIDADGDALAIDASGKISAIVEATDLDIRDLTHVSDSVKIGDGTETANVNASNELQVRDDDANTALTAIQTAVQLLDDTVYTDNDAFVDSTSKGSLIFAVDESDTMQPLKLDANDKLLVSADIDDIADAIAITKVPVTSTATQLKAIPLANRREITIQNLGSQDIYIDDGSATTDDIKVPKGSSATFKWSSSVDVYAITATGTADVRFLEAA